jgi:hypothetical protein
MECIIVIRLGRKFNCLVVLYLVALYSTSASGIAGAGAGARYSLRGKRREGDPLSSFRITLLRSSNS